MSLELSKRRNDISRIFDQNCRIHRNCIRIHPMESKKHFLKKCELAWESHENGEEFLTEAVIDTPKLDERLRADFVTLDDGYISEIKVTEKDESLDRKRELWAKYGLKMVTING